MPPWLPPHHVARPRIADRLAAAPVAVVEAGAGYGKSTLAVEAALGLGVATAIAPLEPGDADPALLVVRLERALRRAGLGDLVAPLAAARSDPEEAVEALADALAARDDPVVLVVDDTHHAEGSAALLGRLAAVAAPRHRLWVLARRLPAAAAGLRDAPGVTRLDAGDLAFTREEAEALCRAVLGSDGPADALLRTSGGWIAALVLGALAAARDGAAADALRGDAGRALGELVREALGRLGREDRAAFLAAARLPLLSPEVADRVTGRPGLLERASAAGLPLARGPGGWWELPGPVADLLAGMAPADPAAAERAVPVFLAAGEPRAALDALLGAGDDVAAARVLGGLPPPALERLDDAEVQAAVGALSPQAVAAAPMVLVHLARACEQGGQIARRAGALSRAADLAAGAGDEALMREVRAEEARDLVRDGRLEDAERLARALLVESGPAEVATRARAVLVLGTVMVRHNVATPEAERVLEDAHRLALAVGRREWAAQARMLLAAGVHAGRGHVDHAVATVEEAVALMPPRSLQRAVALTFRAELLNGVGRYDEAVADLEEARRLGMDLRMPKAVAYAAWEQARTAAQTGDAAAAEALVREADAHRGEWFATETGAIFLADAADLLDRAGAPAAARELLERAVVRRDDSPFAVLLAEGAIAARSGDPHAAEPLLAEAASHPWCTDLERWRITLLRAEAARRRGDPAAGDLAARAMREAAALGDPNLPLVRERRVAEGLADLVRRGGGTSPDPGAIPARIRALGGFVVRRGSGGLTLPPGRPELIVKLLAARDGRAHAEEVIEALWPEVEPASGRKRLRNALSRLRGAAGDLVVRDGDTLALAPGTEVDAHGFAQDAARALAAGGEDRAALARAAAARYGGDLLPDERYEPWAAGPRERLRGRMLALLDLLVADAEARGDADEALRLLERAADADPLDDERALRVARLLLAQGRRGAAEGALRRAEAVLADLGLPPSAAIVALRREVGPGG